MEGRALRFLMAGSVDDGKSTLTGRLLYECQAILADQLGRLRDKGAGTLDLALLTDGLEAEREQGITIDVAFRYLSTRKRKFVIADAPGHEQYTRNMVTAAAGSDAAVILVDITKLDHSKQPVALLAQTRRHTLLASMLRIPSIVFAVNKIDAVADPRASFAAVREGIRLFTEAAGVAVAGIVPISALNGDNVSMPGAFDWYDGPSLLELLEDLPVEAEDGQGDLLIPVQYVSRDAVSAGNSARVIWGRVARGSVKAGDAVQIYPSNERANVVEVRCAGELVDRVDAGRSAGLVLDRHVDVARGSWLSTPHTLRSTDSFTATLAWLDTDPAQLRRKYLIRHGCRWVPGRIVSIESCLDIHTLDRVSAHALEANDIGRVVIEMQEALPLDLYEKSRTAGSLIVVDPSTHQTSGALMVEALPWDAPRYEARASLRAALQLQINFCLSDGAPQAAWTENLSTGGFSMTGDYVLPVGKTIGVEFALPQTSRIVRAGARVVDHRPAPNDRYHYHVAFIGLDAPTHDAIEGLVANRAPS